MTPATRAQLFALPFSKRTPLGPYIPAALPWRDTFVTAARTLEGIATEEYGPLGDRPLVAAATPAENVWLAHWCFSRGVLPLLREPSMMLTAQLAQRYAIDSVLTTVDVAVPLCAALRDRVDRRALQSVTLVGPSFSTEVVALGKTWGVPVTCILALPETGSLASPCPKMHSELVFHCHKRVSTHPGKTLIVSIGSASPALNKYDTGIAIAARDISCACNQEAFTLL